MADRDRPEATGASWETGVDRPPAGRRPTVVVVGGGIAGLAAAWELTGGAEGLRNGGRCVVVVESDTRLGGKLRTERLGGRAVDVGPDAVLGRRPEAVTLAREVGLGSELEPVGATGAAVWARGRRRRMPGGLFLGVPTRFVPVARSGILSPLGTARLFLDLVAPRPDRRGPLGDRAVGPLVTRKLGRQAVRRLVEPLLGGIFAGGVSDASAAAVFPPLLKVSQGRASFMRSMGRLARSEAPLPGPAAAAEGPPAAAAAAAGPFAAGAGGPQDPSEPRPEAGQARGGAEPAFWSLRTGFQTLVDRLASELADRGVEIRTGCPATSLEREQGGWRVRTARGPIDAHGVVLAVPAGPAAMLLAPLDADAAALLQATAYASVAVVTLAYPDDAVPGDLYGTGLLVPRDTPLPPAAAAALATSGDERCLVTACTYLSTKWPHLAAPGQRLVRASVGRFGDERFAALDDDALVDRVVAELAGLLGTTATPTASSVTRWPDALPQYRVHHLLRVGGVEAAARRLGALAVAGAAYRGVGVPACIASGRSAARAVLERLDGGTSDPAGAVEAEPAL